MKLIDSVWKLLAILVLTALFVFLIGICICFLSETLCLRAHQYEIILTFVGIIGTFVVVTNFQQAQECKELAKKEIEGIKKNAQKQIEELVATQKLMSDFVLTSKEYIVANKIVQQNNLPNGQKTVWCLEYESDRHGCGFERVEVKIKSVSQENGNLKFIFMNEEHNELSWLAGKKYISIGEETLNIDNLECRFDNQSFNNWLLQLLKTKEY